MAEGWAKKYLGDEWEVNSAGIEAHGLNPRGGSDGGSWHRHFRLNPDIIDPELLNTADLVVTLCGDAADRCPMTPPQVAESTGVLMTLLRRREQKKRNGCVSTSP
ncbi:hypothetical protein [Paenibacillus dokdonensis]|uniref:hypothetical protein n=1 Tax=Paenibacillus dokdonensis TaxID=2567944 RepID=UPI0010A86376|nr:hypothetical protein [Paenibacillus dokdonensis]